MTPTEQDKELREQIDSWSYGKYSDRIDELLDLITADRKRVELEARIDELENNKWLPNEAKWIEQEADRIAELKAQQEEQ